MLPTALTGTSQSRTGAYQHWLTWQSHFLCNVEEFPSWRQTCFKDTPAGLGTLSGALGNWPNKPAQKLMNTIPVRMWRSWGGGWGFWGRWMAGMFRRRPKIYIWRAFCYFFPPYPLNNAINSFFKKKDLLNHHLVIHLFHKITALGS